MGHQQLLLVIIGLVIVGIAILVGIFLFESNSAESCRSALTGDLLFLAGRAREYYMKPASLGGGSNDFSNVTLRKFSTMTENDNGRYYIESVSHDAIIIVGVGKIVSGNDSIRVRMQVDESAKIISVLN
jgi:hypothetical protein